MTKKAIILEKANMGDWMYANLHSSAVQMVDYQFGGGYMDADEYARTLEAVALAFVVFRQTLQQSAPGLFERRPWTEVDAPVDPGTEENGGEDDQAATNDLTESAPAVVDAMVGDVVPLVEKAIRRDSTAQIKVIAPGWGTSGYYSREVLARDGAKAFPKGTHMYWNHPTATDEAMRPERDLTDLAAVLVSDARWVENGPAGDGLYADAKVFDHYRGKIDEMAPHIGVSIRAYGKASVGEAEGRKGRIIDELAASRGNSVDFVTVAGAGGEILNLFESARLGAYKSNRSGMDAESTNKEARKMDLQALQEANSALQAELDAEKANAARLSEMLLLGEAREYVTQALAKVNLPTVTRVRLGESLAKHAPVKDGKLDIEAFQQAIREAVDAEISYLAEAAGMGKIRGMGGAADVSGEHANVEEAEAVLEEAFQTFGLSERAAKSAAVGRN